MISVKALAPGQGRQSTAIGYISGTAPPSHREPAAIDRTTTLETHRQAVAPALIAEVRALAARGWTPATGGNFSCRIDARHVAMTASGGDKGRIGTDHILVVDLDGQVVVGARRPSAETLLHTHLYRRYADVGAVLHTHSRAQTVASRLFEDAGAMRIEGYELIKAFEGQSTHETSIEIPVFPNNQHMPTLAGQVDARLDRGGTTPGYLIAGHGLYAWGCDLEQAHRHLEALDFLIDCELERLRLSRRGDGGTRA